MLTTNIYIYIHIHYIYIRCRGKQNYLKTTLFSRYRYTARQVFYLHTFEREGAILKYISELIQRYIYIYNIYRTIYHYIHIRFGVYFKTKFPLTVFLRCLKRLKTSELYRECVQLKIFLALYFAFQWSLYLRSEDQIYVSKVL